MRNRTKNSDLRRTIDRTTCFLEQSSANALAINQNDKIANQYNNYKTAQRHTYQSDYDAEEPFNRNDLANHLDEIDTKPGVPANREQVKLLDLNPSQLPCESLAEPTELPLSRESVGMGMDLSRVFPFASSAAIDNKSNQGMPIYAICMLIIAYLMA